ncbi:MAG: single-stranded DNA-binding protein [Pseudanabaenaceae cyanobacterium SKYGB_i_bin29]|nr:single-stranded DNA-binding protein [Pseudanabaenaceae cyanobacterium SKYG29]MDW8421940.1 single-stranded DNA-binding protein [Pseudanabaenaceae cyanobacterium SKYGB_i_bin29]
MNSFTVAAEILSEPELRATPEGQIPVTGFLVQFPSLRPEDPPNRLKVTCWRNLATEVHENYHRGDHVLIEGRLQMNLVDRGNYKEKVAELVAQRVYPLGKSLPRTAAVAEPASTYSPGGVETDVYDLPPMPELPPDEVPF